MPYCLSAEYKLSLFSVRGAVAVAAAGVGFCVGALPSPERTPSSGCWIFIATGGRSTVGGTYVYGLAVTAEGREAVEVCALFWISSARCISCFMVRAPGIGPVGPEGVSAGGSGEGADGRGAGLDIGCGNGLQTAGIGGVAGAGGTTGATTRPNGSANCEIDG